MASPANRFELGRWWWAVQQRFDLDRSAVRALAVSLGLVVAAAAVFAAVGEDVASRDGVARSDPTHLRTFVEHRPNWLVDVAKVVTDFGSAPVLIGLAVLATAVLWWRGLKLVLALAPAISLAVGGALVSMLKAIFGRTRPPVDLRLVSESGPSFPSGHSGDSAAFFVALGLVVAVALLRRRGSRVLSVALGALLAALIATSRLVLGVHWPTDVVAGLALGTGVALASVTVASVVARLRPHDDPTAAGTSRAERVARAANVRRSTRPPGAVAR